MVGGVWLTLVCLVSLGSGLYTDDIVNLFSEIGNINDADDPDTLRRGPQYENYGMKTKLVTRLSSCFSLISCRQELAVFTVPLLNSIPTPRATSSLNKGSKFFLDQSQMTMVWSVFQWRHPLQQIRCTCRLVIIALQIARLSNLLNKFYLYSRAQCSPVLLLLYK